MSGYGVFSQYYDALTDNVDYPARARIFDALAQRYSAKKGLLLDLACGTGSLSVELAALGYDVIGVDGSADMLAVASGKAGMAERMIMFLNQEMTELDLYGTVDVAVCALDSLNHLPDEAALRETIRRVGLFLQPGGVFLFDLNTRYKHREILQNNAFVYDREEFFCVWQNALDPVDDHVDIMLDFFRHKSGRQYTRFTEQFSEHIFSDTVIDRCLRESGLALCGRYAWDDTETLPDTAPGETTQRVLYAAQKKA